MPAPSEKELLYYIGWVDRRTDPWPSHETLNGPGTTSLLDDRPIEFLPANHSEWPGLPFVRGSKPLTITDGRMGQYTWPGIPIDDDVRIYAGPTVAGLLHPRSEANVKKLRRAFLLHQAETPGDEHQRLLQVLTSAAKARGIRNPRERIELAPIEGISDPTAYRSIIDAVRSWLAARDPFELSTDRPAARRVIVNLSPGTMAMATSWLMLFWSGALGGTRCTVEFVQGDGGLSSNDRPGNPNHHPLRIVPLDVLAEVKTLAGAPVRSTEKDKAPAVPSREQPEAASLKIDAEVLAGRPYDRLRRDLEQAALVGEPVVLEGERGSGKTFLAEFFHRRRQEYRWGEFANSMPPAKSESATGKGVGKRPAIGPPWKGGARRLVKVTLSEFGDLEGLKFSLFGWKRRSFTGAGDEDYDGLLGESHEGTLFLDEIHHLPREVQPSLLGPLNSDPGRSRAYAPCFAPYQVESSFDLITATNDPSWRDKLIPDLRDRIGRLVLRVPALRDYQPEAPEVLWRCWEVSLSGLCQARNIQDPIDDDERPACCRRIEEFLLTDKLPGNWRDVQTLATYVLFLMTDARNGRPLPRLRWSIEQTNEAVHRTIGNRSTGAPAKWES